MTEKHFQEKFELANEYEEPEDILDVYDEILELPDDKISKAFIVKVMVEKIKLLNRINWDIQRDILLDEFLERFGDSNEAFMRVYFAQILPFPKSAKKIFAMDSNNDERYVLTVLQWLNNDPDVTIRQLVFSHLASIEGMSPETKKIILDSFSDDNDPEIKEGKFYYQLSIGHDFIEKKDFHQAIKAYREVYNKFNTFNEDVLARWIRSRSTEFHKEKNYRDEIIFLDLILELFATSKNTEVREIFGEALCNKAKALSCLELFNDSKAVFTQYFEHFKDEKSIEMKTQWVLALFQQAYYAYDRNDDVKQSNKLYQEIIDKYKSWTKYEEIQDYVELAMHNLILNLPPKKANALRTEYIEHFEDTRDVQEMRTKRDEYLANTSFFKKVFGK